MTTKTNEECSPTEPGPFVEETSVTLRLNIIQECVNQCLPPAELLTTSLAPEYLTQPDNVPVSGAEKPA